MEPESTIATTTTTSPSTTTEAKTTTAGTEAAPVIQNEQTAESIAEPEQQQQKTSEESTLLPDEQTSITESTPEMSDPDTKSALIQDEKEAPVAPVTVALESEDSDQNRANERLVNDEKPDSQKEEEGGVKDEVAKETQKDGEQVSDDTEEPVAPLASPPAQPAEQEQPLKVSF